MMKHKKILISIALGLMFSCSNNAPVPPMKVNFASSSDAKNAMYDPDNAKLMGFTGAVSMEALEGADGVSVPTIKIEKKGATFVSVLRCKSDYEVKSSTGVKLEALDEFSKYDDMKWIWNKATGDPSNCKFVGTHIRRDRIQDIAANSGAYFYLINPCVSKERSLSGREDCSNDLYKTTDVTYESQLRENFTREASKLSSLEIEVGGASENIKMLAEVIMAEQEACEKVAAIKASNMSFFRGIASLAGAVIGGVVGSIMGGPIGAVKGATSFMGIARDLIKVEYKLDCSAAEKYRAELKTEVERMDRAVDEVVKARNVLAGLDSAYRRLDDLIEEGTK